MKNDRKNVTQRLADKNYFRIGAQVLVRGKKTAIVGAVLNNRFYVKYSDGIGADWHDASSLSLINS